MFTERVQIDGRSSNIETACGRIPKGLQIGFDKNSPLSWFERTLRVCHLSVRWRTEGSITRGNDATQRSIPKRDLRIAKSASAEHFGTLNRVRKKR